MAKKQTSQRDAARVYSTVAKKNGGSVPKGHYAGRFDRAAKRNGTAKKP